MHGLSNGMIANNLEWGWKSLLLVYVFVILISGNIACSNYSVFTRKLERARLVI